jgi:DNA-binding GntR family transcriptional regulator
MSTTSVDRIYKLIAEQIITGDLQPGEKLEEKVLASRFGVSRTPVREALRELSARGLIDLIPRRGGMVAEIGLERLSDMLDAECEVEGLCARLAAMRMTALEKGALREVHDRLRVAAEHQDGAAYLALNHDFHDLICAGSHNMTLADSTRALRERLSPFRQSQADEQGRRFMRSVEEHEAIVDAISRSDANASYESMRLHNARLGTGVLRLLRR